MHQTKEFPNSNSMSESIHHTFKTRFLRDTILRDKDHLFLKLTEFEQYIGHIIYPLSLYGFTTQEVLNGALPDKYRFSRPINEAKANRPMKNKIEIKV